MSLDVSMQKVNIVLEMLKKTSSYSYHFCTKLIALLKIENKASGNSGPFVGLTSRLQLHDFHVTGWDLKWAGLSSVALRLRSSTPQGLHKTASMLFSAIL